MHTDHDDLIKEVRLFWSHLLKMTRNQYVSLHPYESKLQACFTAHLYGPDDIEKGKWLFQQLWTTGSRPDPKFLACSFQYLPNKEPKQLLDGSASSIEVLELSQLYAYMCLQDEGQCLADICDILHCDYIAEEVLGKSGEGVDPYARHLPCDPSEEQKIRQRCRVSQPLVAVK